MAQEPGGKRIPAIDELDLGRLVEKARDLYKWDEARAREAEEWYRNFLFLCHQTGRPVAAIARDADDLWHLHILDTRKYQADCQAIFGRFLDHQPFYERTDAERRLIEETRELYEREFHRLPENLDGVSFGF